MITVTEPASSRPPDRVSVELGARSYEIEVVTGLPEGFGPFARRALERSWSGSACRRAVIITDSNVAARSIPAEYQRALDSVGIAAETVIVPPGESSKSLEQAGRLYDELAARSADRHTLVVALGGGVVGDLAGFVAATFTRGLPLIMVPTTLLAQVDSSVGGKVGINHARAKNLIGAFYQPLGVWIDTETLATLPDREFRSGLAEVVKYGVIASEAFFSFLEQNAERILARAPQPLEQIIVESCRIKARVVARDEREEGADRAMLNFGHTIAHAVENATGYDGRFLHGEAVAIGMVAESRLAEQLGWTTRDVVPRLAHLLERFGLPVKAPGLDLGTLKRAMGRDKKNRLGKIRFVLPREIGRVELTDSPGEELVQSVLETL
jgi:3-dehydroquinate synthase